MEDRNNCCICTLCYVIKEMYDNSKIITDCVNTSLVLQYFKSQWLLYIPLGLILINIAFILPNVFCVLYDYLSKQQLVP